LGENSKFLSLKEERFRERFSRYREKSGPYDLWTKKKD
jgi:hypothetical protein